MAGTQGAAGLGAAPVTVELMGVLEDAGLMVEDDVVDEMNIE